MGVTTEVTDDGYFHLNVIDPAVDDASVSDTVTFRFDDGERIVHLMTTYSFSANDVQQMSLSDFEPCAACQHYVNKPCLAAFALSTTSPPAYQATHQ